MKAQTSTVAGKAAANMKKILILSGLVVLGLLLWGRLLIQRVPRTVTAEPERELQVAGNALQGGGATHPKLETRNPQLPAVRKAVAAAMPNTLSRDLFALDANRYPHLVREEVVIRPPEKSVAKPADERGQAGVFAPKLPGLVLQTTVMGEQPRAVINGQVLAPGQTIQGYTLRKVLPRQAILEINGIELRLEM